MRKNDARSGSWRKDLGGGGGEEGNGCSLMQMREMAKSGRNYIGESDRQDNCRKQVT